MVGEHSQRGSRRYWFSGLGVLVVGAALILSLHVPGAPVHARRVPATSTTTSSTSSVPASTTSSPTTSLSPGVTIAAVGDTELGNTPQLPPDPNTYFDPVRGALSAPIVFGNLEGTFTNATTSKCTPSSTACYAFKVPPRFARLYAAAGFTVLNSANNHAWDFGAKGVASTSAAMKAVGITQAGLPEQIGIVSEGFVSVAFVDFAPYYNTNNMLDTTLASQLIRQAHREADVVVVYMHAGAEGPQADHVTRKTETFYGENRGNPYAFAHFAIDSGADLVIASGPHVLRGLQWYRGHLIDYSLGDFTNYYDFSAQGDLAYSGILRVSMSATGAFESARFVSLLLSPDGQARLDPTGRAATFVNNLSRSDFRASAAIIGPGGAIEPPT